jgi:phospholipase C
VSARSLALVVGCSACLALVGGAASNAAAAEAASKPKTPIKHFITLMQQNRSFDHYFGTYPGAKGVPTGVCMPVRLSKPKSRCIEPFRIGDQPVTELDHNESIFADQYRSGRMSGFIHGIRQATGRVEPAVMGHYDERDIPYYWSLARDYVLFDRFFGSASGGSLRNAMYWVTGTPGNYSGESIPPNGFGSLPTIFDRLEASGVSWKFYVQNYDPAVNFRNRGGGDRSSQIRWVPLLSFGRYVHNRKLSSHIVDLEEYFQDLQSGTLPSVAYIVAPSGGSSEHAPGNVAVGQRFVTQLVNSLMRSDYWKSSAFMWSYDGWGGWYDHVKPPRVDSFGYGFRVPALLVSAYARRGYVDSTTFDSTSILKFIERNWGLEPLASRDRKARTFLRAFDFTRPPREPRFPLPEGNRVLKPHANQLAIYGAYLGTLVLTALVLAWALVGWTPLPRNASARRRSRRDAT